jgi:hypothetical protein
LRRENYRRGEDGGTWVGGERCEKKDKIAKRLEKVKGMGNLIMYKKGISVTMEFRNQSKMGTEAILEEIN